MMLLEDLKEKLKDYDAITLLDLLDISSEELVYYLSDPIEEKYHELVEFLEGEDEGTNEPIDE